MIQNFRTQETITYEQFGFTRRGVKADAPRFRIDPMTHRDARLGEDIITNPANVGPGTVLRGSLAPRAKAAAFLLQLTNNLPYQVATAASQAAANLIVALAGPVGGNPNHLNGWQLHGEFPIRDRTATHNSLLAPRGIAVDANFIWIAQGTQLWRMTHGFAGLTQITPSATAIPAFNGLASDGINLFTTDGAAFYRIVVSGTTYAWSSLATLAFPVAKIGCWTGRYFVGHDSVNALLRMWLMDGVLWRSVPYQEPNFMGALMLNGFIYIANQAGTLEMVQLLPARI